MNSNKRLLVVVAALIGSLLVVVPPAISPAVVSAQTPTLTVDKSAPGEVLAGESISYTITAANTSTTVGDDLFNLTFRDVLPLGVTYASTTDPAGVGDPQIVVNDVTEPTSGDTVQQQTLIWSNVSDLLATDSASITFTVDVNTTGAADRDDVHVIGAVIPNTGEAYASDDERVLPDFDDTGVPVSDPDVVTATSATVTTTLTAIEVTKTSDSAPEGEFLRGVHDHVITYTIEARTTSLGGSDAITVIDLIPAAMEFLGCGAEDNGTSGPGGTPQPEYGGAPLLSATPTVAGCTDPLRVETVEDPVLGGVTYTGVYTLVEWPLGDRAAGETVTLPYAAGIPLFENTTTWATGVTPTTDGPQGSNLDNNNGPSTRETTSESAVVNIVRGQGDFTDGGLLEPGTPATVFDEDTLSRTVEDLRIRKEVLAPASGEFQPGSEARYRIIVETSEYMSASGVVLTDDVPNGLCPKPQQGFTYSVGEPACLTPTFEPTVDFAVVTPDATNGGFEVEFAPLRDMTENDRIEVDYAAFMRGDYEDGPLNGQPTVSGDSFVNEVEALGTTTGIPEIQAPGFRPPGIPTPTPVPDVGTALPGVGDDSQASLDTGTLAISKQILPRDVSPRLDVGDPPVDRCPDPSGGDYIDSPGPLTPADAERLGFRLGDQICFRLEVDFDDTIFTRNALLTDFIPPGTEFVAGSLRATSANTVDFNVASSPAGGPLVIELGTDQTGGRFVNFPDQVFEAVFLVEVQEAAPPDRPILTGNLMKLRTENSAGQAQSFRDEADFAIIPPPPITTIKGVAEVDDPANGPNGANSDVDGIEVRQDSIVTFRIDLTNEGVPENFDNYSAREVEVLDRLPEQFECADVVANSILNFGPDDDLGECLDPGETSTDGDFTNDQETPDGEDISVIRWAFDISDDYALWPAGDPATPPGAGGTRSLFYSVTIPTPSAAGERFDNEAGVRTYGGFTNLQGVTSPGLVPENNIDPNLAPSENAPQSDDDSFIFLPDVDVEKFVRTWIVEDRNNASNPAPPAGEPTTINGESGQSVVGEYVTYRYYVDIPAETSVFDGVLVDIPPTTGGGVPFFTIVENPPAASGALPAAGRFYSDASDSGFTTTLPTGVTFDPSDGSIDFGAEYRNETDLTQRFEVVISAITTEVGLGATNQPTRTNRAEFDSVDSLGDPVDPVGDTASVQIRQPIPALDKSVAPTTNVFGGQTLTYTLAPDNNNNRVPLHDSWVTDCIPEGLDNVTIVDPQGTDLGPEPGNPATNGCPTGSTYVAFFFGTILDNTVTSRSYTVEVSTQSVGNQTYTNTAELTGSSLDDGNKTTPQTPDNPDERSYAADDDQTVRVLGAGAIKTVDPGQATIGETVNFTITVSVPQNTQFFQAAIRDRLPVGLVDPQFVSADCFQLPVPLPDPLPPTAPTCTVPPITTLGPELDAGANVYGIFVGDIDADPSIRTLVFRYTARVDDVSGNVDGVDLVNTAQAVWDTEDLPDPTTPLYPWQEEGVENEATVEVIEPDLDITKVASDTTPEPGQNFGYTITVTNNGRSPAYDVVIEDAIPDGIELLTGALFPFSPNRGGVVGGTPFVDQTITWTETDPLQPGDSIDLTYAARLAPSADINGSPVDDFTNTAQVTEYQSLPDDPTNPDIRDYVGDPVDEIVEPQFPELDVIKNVLTPEPAYLGEPVTWRVAVENVGGGEAFSVDVVDVLPRGWEYESGSTTIERPGIDLDRDPDITTLNATQTLAWPNLGSLEPGESLTVTFRAVATTVVVNPPPFAGGSVRQVNDAAAAAVDGSGAPGNLDGSYEDSDDASTRIDKADVVIEKTNAATPAVAGDDYTWDVVVSNGGPDTAVGPFVVTDTLPVITPDPATFVSATGTGWSCSEAAGTVTCNRTDPTDTLASGAAFAPIEVTVAIPSDYLGDLTNAASVTARTYDEDLTNNTDDATVTVTDEADLEIVKDRVETDIVAGRTVTYTLDVTNNGPSTSRATITVEDTLPANTTFDSAPTAAAGDPWDCAEAAGVVTCTLLEGTTRAPVDDLLANTSAPQIAITVLVDADAPAGVDLTNTAEVIPGATTDPDLDNNTDTDVGPVNTVADLAIDKQATGELVAGQPATYRLRVDNLGPSDAAAPVITDTLPTGLTYVSAASNPVVGGTGTWTCTAGAGNTSFECVLDGPLPVGEFAVVDVTVAVDPNVAGTIVNTARVDSITPDPVPDNNEDDDTSPFDVEADLAITKTAPTTPVVAGTAFQYTLQVTNLGPSTSVSPITVTDGLPVGVDYLGYNDGGDWTCGAVPASQPGFSFIVTCTLGVNLDPSVNGGAAPPIVLDVRALPDAGPATLDNVAAVQGTTFDPNLDNNDDDAPVTLIDEVDVQVVKTPATQTVRAGESATFTLQVTNNGPSTADNVIVVDSLPSGMAVDPVASAPWVCSTPTAVFFSCTLATLDPGDASPITFTALVGAGVPDGTTLVNTTTVSTSSPDTNPDNDSDTADVVVAAEADLAIVKSHAVDPVVAGDDVEFTLDVQNLGPSDAVADLVVVDALPAGFTFVSSSGPWDCVPDGGTPEEITCTYQTGGLLAGTAAADLLITAAVGADVAPGSYDNVADVSSPTTDPDPDNNTDTDTVTVGVVADVSIVKSHDPAAVMVGEELVFTLAVANAGPSDAQDVVVTDTIPAGLEFVSAIGAVDPSTWDCAATVAPDISCSLAGPLTAGSSAEEILVTVLVLPEAYPGVDNTAVAATSTPDPDPSNNSSTDPVAVPPLTDLTITKEHAGEIQVGGQIEYTIVVTNNGPTPDPGVITITDDLPTSLAPLSATGDGLTCDIASQVVSCTVDDVLAVDASVTLTIVANVLPEAYPEVTNVVTVATESTETDLTNNEATDTTPVAPLIDLAVVKTLEEITVGSATWLITVTNLGPNDTIEPIGLVDDLPAGLTFVSIAGDGWVCTDSGQLVECTYDAVVVAGESAPTLTLDTTVTAPPGTEIVNTVSVTGGGPGVSEVTDSAAGAVPPPLPATGGDSSQPINLALMALAAGLLLQLLAWFRRPRARTAG